MNLWIKEARKYLKTWTAVSVDMQYLEVTIPFLSELEFARPHRWSLRQHGGHRFLQEARSETKHFTGCVWKSTGPGVASPRRHLTWHDCLSLIPFHSACHCRICSRAPRCLNPVGPKNARPEAVWVRAWTLNVPRQTSSSSGHPATSTNALSARGKRMTVPSLPSLGDQGGKKNVCQVGKHFHELLYGCCGCFCFVCLIFCNISLRHFMGWPTWWAAS